MKDYIRTSFFKNKFDDLKMESNDFEIYGFFDRWNIYFDYNLNF